MKRIHISTLMAGTLFMCAPAQASVIIDFGDLSEFSNSTPFEGLIEDGFVVTPTAGNWFVANMFGAPTPSIFGRASISEIVVQSETADPFQFFAVDFADASNGGVEYFVEGFFDGGLVFSFNGVAPGRFITADSPDSESSIDLLRITMHRDGASYNIDNIVVNAVPAPSVLMMLSVAGIAAARRRRA